MQLILASEADSCAAWLAAELGRVGLDPLFVTAEALAAGTDWCHEVSDAGAWFTVRLADGRRLDSRRLSGTVNRVQALWPSHIGGADETERAYAEQEHAALFLSVLACVPGPVLNPPTPQGLCGAIRHPSELVWRAAQAGLPTLPYVFEGRAADEPTAGWGPIVPPGAPITTVHVVDGTVVGALPPGLREGAAALAADLDVPLLGVDLLWIEPGRPAFAGASPVPPLSPGGGPLVAAIGRALGARAGEAAA